MADLRIERFDRYTQRWLFVRYATTVKLAQECADRMSMIGRPTRVIDADGVELYRKVHRGDPHTYAEA